MSSRELFVFQGTAEEVPFFFTLSWGTVSTPQVRKLAALSLRQPVRLAADAAATVPTKLCQQIMRLKVRRIMYDQILSSSHLHSRICCVPSLPTLLPHDVHTITNSNTHRPPSPPSRRRISWRFAAAPSPVAGPSSSSRPSRRHTGPRSYSDSAASLQRVSPWEKGKGYKDVGGLPEERCLG